MLEKGKEVEVDFQAIGEDERKKKNGLFERKEKATREMRERQPL